MTKVSVYDCLRVRRTARGSLSESGFGILKFRNENCYGHVSDMADEQNRKAIVPPVDGFTIREVDPTKVSFSPRDGRYERLVRSLKALPENTPVEIIPEDRSITLASFRATLLSQASRMVPPVRLHTQFNETKTGLVVWRRAASRK